MIDRREVLSALKLLVVTLALAMGCAEKNVDDMLEPSRLDEGVPDGQLNSTPDMSAREHALAVCVYEEDCAPDEACTQGGRCVNITGERSATAVLQADLDALPLAVGLGVPYGLPPRSILLLDDPDGNGVALQIGDRIILDGQGALLRVQNDLIAIEVGPASNHSSIRNLSIEPVDAEVEHEGIGIAIYAPGVRLDNLHIKAMGRGVYIPSSPEPLEADRVAQQWNRLVFEDNHQYAIAIEGEDVHGGLIAGVQILGGNGIRDRSFIGNVYIAPTISETRLDSLTLESTQSASLVLGAQIDLISPAPRSQSEDDLHIGGSAIDRLLGPGDRVGGETSYLRFRAPTGGMRLEVPASNHAAFAFKHGRENQWWYLRYFPEPDDLTWGLVDEQGERSVYNWSGVEHPQGPALYDLGAPLFPE